MSLVEALRAALCAPLPPGVALLSGDAAESKVAPDPVPAAVLVPIVEGPDPGVILTLRTESVRRHAGQIAFPGGRIDPGDAGPVGAALREAWEEIALPSERVEVIGTADPYRTVTGYEVVPVLGIVPAGLTLVPQPAEVAAIFEAPLAELLDPRRQIMRSRLWQGHERRYYEIEWQGRRIWGATAAMIVNLTRRLGIELRQP